MLSSHSPLRWAERTRSSRASYYRVGAVNGSSARSISSRRLSRTRSPRVDAHMDNPTWPLRSSRFRALEGLSDQLRFSQMGRRVTRRSRPARLKLA
jgi:hypothetical protein